MNNDDAFKPRTDDNPIDEQPPPLSADEAADHSTSPEQTEYSAPDSTEVEDEDAAPRMVEAEWVNEPAPVDDPLAVAALIASIVGLAADVGMLICCIFSIGPVLSLVGAVLGGVALKRIKDHPEQYKGEAYAWIGIALGVANLLLFAVMMLFGVGLAVFSETMGN